MLDILIDRLKLIFRLVYFNGALLRLLKVLETLVIFGTTHKLSCYSLAAACSTHAHDACGSSENITCGAGLRSWYVVMTGPATDI